MSDLPPERAEKAAGSPYKVEIDQRDGKPTTCKVWRDGVLVFDGVDRSALATVARVRHALEGPAHRPACSCGDWEAPLGASIHREFDRHLLEADKEDR